jgi:DNA-binding IclR family transcriptional regulator
MKKNQGSSAKKPVAVQSIYRAANILACIGKQTNTITEIAAASKLSNSTVHRILQALEDSRMVVKDPINRKYYFGDLITSLAMDILVPHEYLITVTKEYMNPLAEETEETISLAVQVGQQYNALCEIPSKHKLRVVEARTNIVEPLQPFGAAAMVLLSQLDDKEMEARVHNMQLTAKIENREQYIKHIKRVRKLGYAITRDDITEGSMSISCPVFHYLLPAVLNIYGPKDRMKNKSKHFLELLNSSAQQISQRLSNTVKAKAPRKPQI